MKKLTDIELVQQSLVDPEDFGHLIDRYENRLTAYVKRLGRFSNHDAEDLLQEIFLKVYENLNDYDQRLKFSAWIYRIARNHVIDHFRKNKNKALAFDNADSLAIFEKIADELNIEKATDNELLQQQVQEILQQLKPDYREVLILKYLEDQDYQEISDILKKPMGTIATLLNRAKKQFQKTYKHHLTPAS